MAELRDHDDYWDAIAGPDSPATVASRLIRFRIGTQLWLDRAEEDAIAEGYDYVRSHCVAAYGWWRERLDTIISYQIWWDAS